MNKKNLIFIVLAIMLLIPKFTNALELNSNSLINEQSALKYKKEILNEEDFYLSNEWFDDNGELLPIIATETKYVETITKTDKYGNVLSLENNIISEEEYNNYTSTISSMKTRGISTDNEIETNAKKLKVTVMLDDPDDYSVYKVSVVNIWKTMPKVRSFDTIGLLYNGTGIESLTNAYGYQYFNYEHNTSRQSVNYSWHGNNMKLEPNGNDRGVSISQNILDDTYSILQNELWAYFNITQGSIRFNASYQHAVKSIDLAISKNFTFDVAGMGGVFNWNTSTSNWDNMDGVCKNITSQYLWYC